MLNNCGHKAWRGARRSARDSDGARQKPRECYVIRAVDDVMVRAERARCLPRDRGTSETARHDISQQLPNNYPTTTRTTTRLWPLCY